MSCNNMTMAPEIGQCSPAWDSLLAGTLLVCTLTGTPGNLLSLAYFYSNRRMTHFFRQLHIAVCCIDFFICCAHLPVAASLFSDRYPALFGEEVICSLWAAGFMFLQKISMFLVMLLSVCRCFSIVYPDKRLNKRRVVLTIPFFVTLLMAHETMVFIGSGKEVSYFFDIAHCLLYGEEVSDMSWYTVDKILHGLEVGIIPLVCFTSFILCVVKLRSASLTESSRARNKEAAVTVTMFTGLFLVCNLPFFLITVLEYVDMTREDGQYPGPMFRNNFMFWYSWTLSRVVFTVLNATFNPVLYFYRIPGVKEWIVKLFK